MYSKTKLYLIIFLWAIATYYLLKNNFVFQLFALNGWMIIYLMARGTSKRNEIRALCDQINDDVRQWKTITQDRWRNGYSSLMEIEENATTFGNRIENANRCIYLRTGVYFLSSKLIANIREFSLNIASRNSLNKNQIDIKCSDENRFENELVYELEENYFNYYYKSGLLKRGFDVFKEFAI